MYQPFKVSFSVTHRAPYPPFFYGPQLPPRKILAREILLFAADRCGFPATDLVSRSRGLSLDRCKHLTAFCIHKLRPDMSYGQIGKQLGGKDHSTILHSLHMAIALRLKDRDFYELSEAVIDHFRSRS